jgi:hypothetical protein
MILQPVNNKLTCERQDQKAKAKAKANTYGQIYDSGTGLSSAFSTKSAI